MASATLRPIPAPLYDARADHDACGVGFVATACGPSTRLPALAIEALAALGHRGGLAADARTGDGAGISLPLPAPFVARVVAEAGSRPLRGPAIGMVFLPTDAEARRTARRRLERSLGETGLAVAGWRNVPVDERIVAGRLVAGTPHVTQLVVPRPRGMDRLRFGRRLLLARRRFERLVRDEGIDDASVVSLSAETIVYKGLFIGAELGDFYADLTAPEMVVSYAIFHQRYSTNTFPSWRLAQPFRYLAHNGEFNTVRANREQMRGRRHALGGGRWVRTLVAEGPVISEGASDSLSLDETLELCILAGRPVDRALLELVPPAPGLTGAGPVAQVPAVEPWDGPAAIVFGDGRLVGALLDRNGLRPAAYSFDRDGLLVLASEAGCIEVTADRVTRRGRLGPGEMLLFDARAGRLLAGGAPIAAPARPPPNHQPDAPAQARTSSGDRLRVALGLDAELLRAVVRPMALGGREPVWSMGDDTPIGPLARRPRRAADFLRQAFAQVTNPAIDPERERIVMSLEVDLGPRPRLLDARRRTPPSLRLPSPVLDEEVWSRTVRSRAGWRIARLDATWPVAEGPAGLDRALERLGRRARAAVRGGARLLVVSDRRAGRRRAAVPSVLAAGRVHQALIDAGRRPLADVAVEAGDLLTVHDVAMSLAAGASAVYPWLFFELAAEVAGSRGAEALSPGESVRRARDALDHGLRKVLARMGISSLRSYSGSQLFDVVGLDRRLVACFPAAPACVGSVGAAEIGSGILERHARAYAETFPGLIDPGLIRYRSTGELHAFAPPVVKALQAVADARTTTEIAAAGERYLTAVQRETPAVPRDLLRPVAGGPRRSLDSVEPASTIVRRFVSSAMSLGALSPEAHQTLAIGMNRLGASSNTGEGGEDPAWYELDRGGDRRESAIKQVASARFGVTADYLARAEQLEIKIAQGSKPGEGGQLPGRKVTAFIAGLRRGQPGMTMISPPPHHDIYSIEDLAQLITDLRAINPGARIGVKLVAGAGIGTIAAGVAKAGADYIMVSGHAGGTGASPLSSIKHVGLPWELGLAEVHQVLVRNRLRDRVALRVDGGLQTGRDVVLAALLGAEEFGFGTATLVALGCDMARQCHLDTCPTGIATQRDDLRAKFSGTPEQIVALFSAIAEDVRAELAGLGLASVADAIGRTDLLVDAGQAGLDLSRLLAAPAWSVPGARRAPPKDAPERNMGIPASRLEADLLPAALNAFAAGRLHTVRAHITTRERSFGAMLAGEMARRPVTRSAGSRVEFRLQGSAGQSLGAFATDGMRIVIDGEANDYVGKGLSGGTLVVRPPVEATYRAHQQAIAGNTCLYGATGGRLHLVGRAGMRFAVRNSGATAVVEGLGAHGCEYMTAGTVVVLGPVGPNFGAGMTGGRAYVHDPTGVLPERLHTPSVVARPVADDATAVADQLRSLVEAHAVEGSQLAERLLTAWPVVLRECWSIEPHEAAEMVARPAAAAAR
jgi:glutamate synthase (ferredoxin)